MDNQNSTENIEKLIHDGNQFIYDQNFMIQEQNKLLDQENINLMKVIEELEHTNSKLNALIVILLIPYIVTIVFIILSAAGLIVSTGFLSHLLGL